MVPSDVRLIVILHGVEARKMSNTGHYAKLVVPDCRVAIHGTRGGIPVDLKELEETHAADGRLWRTALFFPGLGAQAVTRDVATALRAPGSNDQPTRLRIVIPDGTWSQARRMVKRLPTLACLPRYVLPPSLTLNEREAMRPRGNPDLGRVSTCEAIAAVFGALGEVDAERALLDVYNAAALRIALMRGKMPLEPHRDILIRTAVDGAAGDSKP